MSDKEILEKLTTELDEAVQSGDQDAINEAFDRLDEFSEGEITGSTKDKASEKMKNHVLDGLTNTISDIDKLIAEHEFLNKPDEAEKA